MRPNCLTSRLGAPNAIMPQRSVAVTLVGCELTHDSGLDAYTSIAVCIFRGADENGSQTRQHPRQSHPRDYHSVGVLDYFPHGDSPAVLDKDAEAP